MDVGNGLAEIVAVESVKKLVEGNNGLVVDKLWASDSNQDGFSEGTNVGNKVIENIETIDVGNSEYFELTKSRLEKLIGNDIHNMKRQVGVGDLRKYEDELLRVNDALLLRLLECLICLVICSVGQEYWYKANTSGEFILTIKEVFDPGEKRAFGSVDSSVENVFTSKQALKTNYGSQILSDRASYFLVDNSWLRSKEYEFERINKWEWNNDFSVVVVILYVKISNNNEGK
ncbi:hypothetical protein CTI12_AA217610 [Artemisia annua]|uniref:Uncharacterized protein n=1 Tax=Artemisia annua TaxID=35608 RepID=A0A2U1NXU2_ARTAN|nr:hypothetical protein CTI12_AA217610 [Artemisia annua]